MRCGNLSAGVRLALLRHVEQAVRADDRICPVGHRIFVTFGARADQLPPRRPGRPAGGRRRPGRTVRRVRPPGPDLGRPDVRRTGRMGRGDGDRDRRRRGRQPPPRSAGAGPCRSYGCMRHRGSCRWRHTDAGAPVGGPPLAPARVAPACHLPSGPGAAAVVPPHRPGVLGRHPPDRPRRRLHRFAPLAPRRRRIVGIDRRRRGGGTGLRTRRVRSPRPPHRMRSSRWARRPSSSWSTGVPSAGPPTGPRAPGER